MLMIMLLIMVVGIHRPQHDWTQRGSRGKKEEQQAKKEKEKEKKMISLVDGNVSAVVIHSFDHPPLHLSHGCLFHTVRR